MPSNLNGKAFCASAHQLEILLPERARIPRRRNESYLGLQSVLLVGNRLSAIAGELFGALRKLW